MKRAALLSAATIASAMLYAAPVGNTATPQLIEDGFFISSDFWIDLRLGYEGDFVVDGKMKQRQEGTGRVDSYAQHTNSGTATLNFLDRLDLYGVFGSSHTHTAWRFLDAANAVHHIKMETRYHFLWGVGARTILFEWGKVDLGFGGRYALCNYEPDWLTIDGVAANVANTHCRWREYQVNLDLSYKIDLFTPYIGIKYSNARTQIGDFATAIASNGSGDNHFRNRTPVGLYIGCALSTGKYFMLNIEGRLIDEEAVTISGDFRFY